VDLRSTIISLLSSSHDLNFDAYIDPSAANLGPLVACQKGGFRLTTASSLWRTVPPLLSQSGRRGRQAANAYPLAPPRNSVAPPRNSVALTKNSVAPTRNSVALTRNPVALTRNPVALTRNPVALTRNSVAANAYSFVTNVNSFSVNAFSLAANAY
jgi:hypothetical protein